MRFCSITTVSRKVANVSQQLGFKICSRAWLTCTCHTSHMSKLSPSLTPTHVSTCSQLGLTCFFDNSPAGLPSPLWPGGADRLANPQLYPKYPRLPAHQIPSEAAAQTIRVLSPGRASWLTSYSNSPYVLWPLLPCLMQGCRTQTGSPAGSSRVILLRSSETFPLKAKFMHSGADSATCSRTVYRRLLADWQGRTNAPRNATRWSIY